MLLNPQTGQPHCDRCRTELTEATENSRRGPSQKANFRTQLSAIHEKLKQTEGMEIPHFDRTDMELFKYEAPTQSLLLLLLSCA